MPLLKLDLDNTLFLGARSVWVSGGRPWTEVAYRPTHVADDAASAVDHVIGVPQ